MRVIVSTHFSGNCVTEHTRTGLGGGEGDVEKGGTSGEDAKTRQCVKKANRIFSSERV